jgi:DNA invertase Pin-like site-specific DNA recombinase
MQLRDLRAYCTARQLDVVREYVDAGQSGTKDSRPELNELMSAARKRKLDAVIVWRFDRFARSSRHLLAALEEFRALGVGFISYQENIDTCAAGTSSLHDWAGCCCMREAPGVGQERAAGVSGLYSVFVPF